MVPEVSIIIPVYNVEKLLPRCLESLISQTCRSWEAICVDDGSSDGSADVIDAFCARDSRIRAIHKANGGVSSARNIALDSANGNFVMYVDSDDFLHPQALEICLSKARESSSDIVAFTYDRTYRTICQIRHLLHIPDTAKKRFRRYAAVECKVVDDIFEWATEWSDCRGIPEKKWAVKHCQPWRCLYKAETVKGILFPEGIMYEDFPWWSEVMLRVHRAAIVNLPLYFYYPNKHSYILSSDQSFRIESLRKAIPAAKALFEDADREKKNKWEKNFLEPFEEKLKRKESGR